MIFRALVAIVAVALSTSPIARAQSGGPAAATSDDRVVLTPARLELTLEPGEETTRIVSLRYLSTAANASVPARLKTSLGDWSQSRSGELQFAAPGTHPDSACPWIVYSPSEIVAAPGQTASIRVTVTVPKDAAPGDHLAALFVEPRVGDVKLATNDRRIQVSIRLAVLVYVMVPGLTHQLALDDLTAVADADGVTVTPTLSNSGNCHVRPLHSVELLDGAGRVVGAMPAREICSVLARSNLSQPLRIPGHLAPGVYGVRYRADAQDGGRIIEGETEVAVPAPRQ